MALDIAPGLRRHFTFEKLKNFDKRLWHGLLQQSARRQKPSVPLSIYGSDLSAETLKSARTNLAAAGLKEAVSLKQANILEISAPAKGRHHRHQSALWCAPRRAAGTGGALPQAGGRVEEKIQPRRSLSRTGTAWPT
jgi:hypothetical protein